MATLGNPVVSFDQNNILRQGDDGVCCRLAYKWLASQVDPSQVKGGTFKFGGVNLHKTLDKQAAYLKDADPYEKQSPAAWQQGVTAVSLKWLNIWGAKHGLKFETILSAINCAEYFSKGFGKRSAIIGSFGQMGDGSNWAHATAYFAGGPKFFDANKGEFDLNVNDPGAALDNYHTYLASNGETLDRFIFWALP
jgi:hypothetical protein